MRYLVTGRIKPKKIKPLLRAIRNRTLGKGSIAGGEYIRNMKQARLLENGDVRWVEVCYCPTPLMEEIPYWEEYFELTDIRDAHGRHKCRDETGEESWACSNCDCTKKLEQKMEKWGERFLENLKRECDEFSS
jgi:hypothetical protein